MPLGPGVILPFVSREWKNGSNSSSNCTPFLHSLLTKGKLWASGCRVYSKTLPKLPKQKHLKGNLEGSLKRHLEGPKVTQAPQAETDRTASQVTYAHREVIQALPETGSLL